MNTNKLRRLSSVALCALICISAAISFSGCENGKTQSATSDEVATTSQVPASTADEATAVGALESLGIDASTLGIEPNILYDTENPTAFLWPPPWIKNSDAEKVCETYNHSVISHFKPSLLKNKEEFKEPVFCGLSSAYELKYIMEETNSKTILSYFSIITADNINYTATITIQEGYNVDYSLIFGFINRELRRRKKDFNLFVKVLKYVKDNERLEEYLKRKDGVCIGMQLILVKDFYKLIKEPSSKKLGIVLFNDSSQSIRTNFKIKKTRARNWNISI